MEDTLLNQRAPYIERFTFTLILPRLFVLGQVGLIGGFGIVLFGMLWLIHSTTTPVNPFNDYADVFPGQPSSTITAHGFSCPMQGYNYFRDMSEMYCRKTSETDIFSSVDVIYSSGLIHRLSFELREGQFFNVGEVALLLNLTEIRLYRGVMFNWQGHFAHAQLVKQTERLSLTDQVWQVTLTSAPMFRP